MSDFLQGYQNNMLLTAVFKDLNVPEYLAGCKALGLVSKLVTVPLWCQIEDSDTHIMDMDNIYHQVVEYISFSVENLDEFMSGKLILPFANENKTRNNEIFQCLILDWEHDHLVQVHLKVILPAMLAVAKKLFSDHLEGGKWKDVNNDLREKTAGVPKHNKFSESIFGHIDRILREKPNVSDIALESYVMFIHNGISEWLAAKNGIERKSIISDARKNVAKARKMFREREKKIQEEQRAIVQKKLMDEQIRKEKQLLKLEKFTNDIIHWGLWQSNSRVDEMLNSISSVKEKVLALRAQLNFRKYVLKQEITIGEGTNYGNKVYLVTKVVDGKRKNLKWQELACNVKTLLVHSFSAYENDIDSENHTIGSHLIMGKRVHLGFKGKYYPWLV